MVDGIEAEPQPLFIGFLIKVIRLESNQVNAYGVVATVIGTAIVIGRR